MRTWFRRVVRVWCLSGVLSLVVVAVVAQRGLARTERALSGLGQHLMRYGRANHQTPPRELLINGASVFFSVGSTDASIAEVMEHFHAVCRRRGPQLADAWRNPEITDAARSALGGDSVLPLLDGVVRFETDGRGVLACVDTGGRALSPADLRVRLERFFKTGDAAEVGDLRYVLAERARDKTVLVTAWTDGPLNVQKMFPKDRDAPGIDVPGLPRPSGSRRLLSTLPRDGSDMVTIYRAPMTNDQLHAFYVSAFQARGFAIAGNPDRAHDFVVARRGDEMLSLALTEHEGEAVAVLTRSAGTELALMPSRP